ncbi:transporter substrate-binding domain-containing protein [Xanthobacter autotrophicus]|uniref:transporter substrate-binding domain-containing protein n=1 Tax=Xanthobacter TaxID=279 RepID=UPI0024ABFD2C|nr:transporter substrate-binding domain-containing protein [Xanthobacter autotrophicus]MDI4666712.1 transporter substrate-binding domain-containing protein [Xanthobacter autotrophicus]
MSVTLCPRRSAVRLVAGVLVLVSLLAAALGATAFGVVSAGARGPAPDFSGRPLRVGVAWLPPPDTPDMRLYMEEGFELDLAAALARALSADLSLVRVAPEAAAHVLKAGEVDLVLTRASTEDPLRRHARVVETGFSSGLSLAMRSDRPLAGWSALQGRTVCVTEANAQGLALAVRLGAQVRVLRAPAQALMSVRTGECDAALHDRALLDPLFGKMSWQKFSATLPPMDPTDLVVAVAPDAAGLAEAVEGVLRPLATPQTWQARREKWASTVSFEVYRDQVAADCH